MIFKKKISKKDQEYYSKIVQYGNPNKALDLFIVNYILPIISKYQEYVKPLILKATSKFLPSRELSPIMINIQSAGIGIEDAIVSLYNKFNSAIYSEAIFKKLGVTNPLVKQTIKNNSLALFKDYTKNTLSSTNPKILNTIRKMQREILKNNARIDLRVKAGEILGKEAELLKQKGIEKIRNLNKSFKDLTVNDKFIKYSNGSLHKFDEYAEMSIRTTVLNTERTAVEMQEIIKERRVSEYYVRDTRTAKEPRQVCKHIMSKKFRGKSLIAHDEAAANILGIMTIEQATNQKNGAFGPNCRHSIKSLSESFYNRIDNILTLSEKEAV